MYLFNLIKSSSEFLLKLVFRFFEFFFSEESSLDDLVLLLVFSELNLLALSVESDLDFLSIGLSVNSDDLLLVGLSELSL